MKKLCLTLALFAVLNGSNAFALDDTTIWAYGYMTSANSSPEFTQALASYGQSLTAKSDSTLRSAWASNLTARDASCAMSGVLVGLSAAAETLPIAGMIPKIATKYDTGIETALDFQMNLVDDGQTADGFSTIMGGALSSLAGGIRAPFAWLAHGSVKRPFLYARTAYEGTRGLARDLLWRDSACAKYSAQLGLIDSELSRRATTVATSSTANGSDPKTSAPATAESSGQVVSSVAPVSSVTPVR